MRASELFIRCLEVEGVSHIFGIPGEETIELLEAIRNSNISFVTTRHEQSAAFMANAWGRFTHRPGVCLSTLGPGATNLITGIGDAFLDFSPVVAITGQTDLSEFHKESHQYVDIPSIFRPLTKWNMRIERADVIPEVIRKAFMIASLEKPGPTHIEVPQDIANGEVNVMPLRRSAISYPYSREIDIEKAVQMIRNAMNPLILAGNGILRVGASSELMRFAEKANIAVTTTFMGMGAMPANSRLFISTTGLQSRDYISCGFEKADLIITIGYDFVEFGPSYWNPEKDKKIIHIGATPAEIDAHYDAFQLSGDIRYTLSALTELIDFQKQDDYFLRLRESIDSPFMHDIRGFPLKPQRIIREIRDCVGREDILISDVGAHKIWIARFYPVYEPLTAIISNGFASMGFALPSAIVAGMLYPERKVVAVMGDGGFMMSVAELETAMRYNIPVVCLIFNDSAYGLISWKHIKRFGHDFGCRFGNPDFVRLAESFGARGYRVEAEHDLGEILKDALSQDRPSVIDCPVDYTENFRLTEILGRLICPT
jgi:acetolactate synthase-1/2/3 large subunit